MKMLDTKSFIQDLNLSYAHVMKGIISEEEAEKLRKLYLLKAISTSFDNLIQRYILLELSDMNGRSR